MIKAMDEIKRVNLLPMFCASKPTIREPTGIMKHVLPEKKNHFFNHMIFKEYNVFMYTY